MTISVVIPTFFHLKDLKRCLEALHKQTFQADEILVVVNNKDIETCRFFELNQNIPNVKMVKVYCSGQVAALNAGIESAEGEIIAFTDEDAAPHPDWLERIEKHFKNNSNIGGVGGKDYLFINGKVVDGVKEEVDVITWYGRIIGNNHLGYGESREVDHLKGANMSYRKTAISNIRFEKRLRGRDVPEYRNDMGFSGAIKLAGWKLIYDPLVVVDHYRAQRVDGIDRMEFNWRKIVDEAHNETLVILEYFPLSKRIFYFFWSLLIGSIGMPGLIQFFRIIPREKGDAFLRISATMRGRFEGMITWLKNKKG